MSMLRSHSFYFMILFLGILILFAAYDFITWELHLPRLVFGIPSDQPLVVLSRWSLPTYPKDISKIVSDFAGNAYFSESGVNKIGRLEPTTNMITEWPLLTNSSKPTDVAFDPASGSIYFAESGVNKIGRLDPATNMITEWTLHTNSTKPGFGDTIFDPESGSVFFVENSRNTIGRLDPKTNTFTEWGLTKSSNDIQSISSGFDGIYFTEGDTNKIGRLDVKTNTITEWRMPTDNNRPSDVAFDPSTGSVYFAEGQKIGRLIPGGNVFTEWSIGNRPLTISVGPGGSFFYIDEVGRIGRLG